MKSSIQYLNPLGFVSTIDTKQQKIFNLEVVIVVIFLCMSLSQDSLITVRFDFLFILSMDNGLNVNQLISEQLNKMIKQDF